MVSTPSFSGLTTRISGPARLLAARLGQISRPRSSHQPPPPVGAGGLLEGRVHVPVKPVSDESLAWDHVRGEIAALAAAGAWDQVLGRLRQADQTRSAAPGGRRLAALISQGALSSLALALASRDWEAAKAEVARLEDVLAPQADDYAAAHLLAQAHIDLGWARRGVEPGPGLPRDVWKDFLRHTELAEDVLDRFDPIESMSPLLAGTRYHLVRGLEDGDALCRDWYEDWSDLDPTGAEPHSAHAVHLLPHWFGTLAGFDAEARAAMRRTQHGTGAAAYALFYLSAAEALGDLPHGVDLALFLLGLTDYFRVTGCQYRANVVAGALTELDHNLSVDALPGSRRRTAVREALQTHLRENLREFHLSAWENGASCIQYALGQVFERELSRGEHVFVDAGGLTTRRPS